MAYLALNSHLKKWETYAKLVRLKQEGIEEGRKEELIRTSIKLLTKKFGILPDDIKNKIENSDTTALEIIVDGILDFEKL